MGKFYLGAVGDVILNATLLCYVLATQIFYAVTSAKSFATVIPIVGLSTGLDCSGDLTSPDYPKGCSDAYYVWLTIFIVITTLLSLFNITDTAIIQQIFTVYRWLVVVVIVVCDWWSLGAGPAILPTPDRPQRTSPPYVAEPMNWGWNSLAGVAYLAPSIAFAFIFHYCQTNFMEPLRDKEKNAGKFSLLLNGSLLAIYLLLGISSTLVFGESAPDLIIWAFQHWAGGSQWHSDSPPIWASIVTRVVLLFPALSLMSVYPLNTYSISEDIYAIVVSAVKHWRARHGDYEELIVKDEDIAPQTRLERVFPPDPANRLPAWPRVVVRLAVSLFPALTGAVLRSSSVVIKLCGAFGFVFLFAIPPLCVIFARRRVDAIFGSEVRKQSPHSHFTGHMAVCIGLLLVCLVCVPLSLASSFNLIH